MALSAKLQLRQTQSLVITPQLMQAIRLLQMSGVELERFIAAELEANPLLEEGAAEAPPGEDEPEQIPADRAEDGDQSAHPERREAGASPIGEPDRYPSIGGGGSSGNAAWDEFGIDQRQPVTESLEQLLQRKIEAIFAGRPADRAIALALLAALDGAGYLTAAPQAVAERLGGDGGRVLDVLRECQDLAPTGVFARSLAECLSLQLAEENRLDAPMRTLLDNLDRLAAGERAELCLLCGVDRQRLEAMVRAIRTLDPKPGAALEREPVRVLIPDVLVRPAPGGDWSVELNDSVLPRILVNRSYYARVSPRLAAESEKRYLVDCLQKASWLEKSLDQRARTVLKVATEIVRRQDAFLHDGVESLRPLNLRMVADALGIHESTVSRAAANKTIATPRGIFEFRYFFTGAIPASFGGDGHSAEAVKHKVRQLILAEPPDGVLSDDAIVAILARQGIEIARRTVAKYRDMMRIGSSVERRRLRRLKVAS